MLAVTVADQVAEGTSHVAAHTLRGLLELRGKATCAAKSAALLPVSLQPPPSR
jgi:hypothetical protein